MTRFGFLRGDRALYQGRLLVRVLRECDDAHVVLCQGIVIPRYYWLPPRDLVLCSQDTGDPPALRRNASIPCPLKELGLSSYANAQAKGFYEEIDATCRQLRFDGRPELAEFVLNLWRLARCALIHSEISEAVEAIRNRDIKTAIGPDGKPEGLGSEYADAVIRLADCARFDGIDLDREVSRKAEYNKTRPYKHGGKSA